MNLHVALLLFTALAVPLPAQSATAPKAGAFDVGQNVAGAVVGFGSIGSATASIGGRFEHAIKELPSVGNGILGFALDADFYHYTDAFDSGVSLTYIPIGGSVNYHFRLDDHRWDPFLGAGLGYSIASVSGSGSRVTAGSTLYLISRAGVRYFYSPNVAFQADAGAGAAALSLGVVFRM